MLQVVMILDNNAFRAALAYHSGLITFHATLRPSDIPFQSASSKPQKDTVEYLAAPHCGVY